MDLSTGKAALVGLGNAWNHGRCRPRRSGAAWFGGPADDAAAIEAALRDDARHEDRRFVSCIPIPRAASPAICAGRALPSMRPAIRCWLPTWSPRFATPFSMRDLGVDVAVGGSPEGPDVQPGVGFIGVNQRADAVALANPTRASTGTGACVAASSVTASSAATAPCSC